MPTFGNGKEEFGAENEVPKMPWREGNGERVPSPQPIRDLGECCELHK